MFIQLFGSILRLRNILTSFDEFAGNEILSERDYQDYQSLYLDYYGELRRAALLLGASPGVSLVGATPIRPSRAPSCVRGARPTVVPISSVRPRGGTPGYKPRRGAGSPSRAART